MTFEREKNGFVIRVNTALVAVALSILAQVGVIIWGAARLSQVTEDTAAAMQAVTRMVYDHESRLDVLEYDRDRYLRP